MTSKLQRPSTQSGAAGVDFEPAGKSSPPDRAPSLADVTHGHCTHHIHHRKWIQSGISMFFIKLMIKHPTQHVTTSQDQTAGMHHEGQKKIRRSKSKQGRHRKKKRHYGGAGLPIHDLLGKSAHPRPTKTPLGEAGLPIHDLLVEHRDQLLRAEAQSGPFFTGDHLSSSSHVFGLDWKSGQTK